MQYRSPIPVLQYAGAPQEQPDVNSLLRIQKRLLVELDHGGTGSLQVGTQSLTKDDILTLIEDLKQQQSYLFHQWIYDNPRLLALLEKGTAPAAGPLYDRNLSYRAEFRQFKTFISPYLVQPVGKGINQAFLKRDFATARSFLLARHLLEPTFFDNTFGKLGHSLKSLAEEIKRTERKEINFVAAHYDFVDGTFVDFLNDLPEALSQYREMLAIALINLSVEIQRTYADFCQRIYSYLQGLNCSPETKRIIMQNRAIFNRHQEKQEATSGNSSSKSGCGPIIGIAFFIITLLRVLINLADDDDHGYTGPNLNQTSIPGTSITPSEMGYQTFTARIRRIVKRQLTAHGKDSIAEVIRRQPRYVAPADVPLYPDFCEPLLNYQPQNSNRAELSNNSDYDIVVFLRNQQTTYVVYLAKGQKVETRMVMQDVLSFYPGNNWSHDVTFKANLFMRAGVERTVRGVFLSPDSTTLDYLKRSYQFLGGVPSHSVIGIAFTSDTKGSLQVIGCNNTHFTEYEGFAKYK
ncbi:hypothetical protein [Parachryseolinea silvisoli]|uniref:hypothetical protein n=1 Tax=Parachryseolinea silvisoli TaxID=2873601 RepID=UPI0022659AD2|nr:hypothetical protein [Parachryseolinea silvisoli]MCD9019483.1 hypothetical protein [Parachryseolinea silvisoli]